MPAVTVLSLIALAFAIVAAGAVTAVAVRGYLLTRRRERMAATLTAEALVGVILSPTFSKAGGLLLGLRRGLGELVKHGRGANGAR